MIPDIKKRASHRSKILEGQLKGLTKAIDEERYCVDILTQSLAIQQALKSLNKLILENHLMTHVKAGMKTDDESDKDRLVQELLKLYDLSNVRGDA